MSITKLLELRAKQIFLYNKRIVNIIRNLKKSKEASKVIYNIKKRFRIKSIKKGSLVLLYNTI